LAGGIFIPQAILRFTSTPHQHRTRKNAFAGVRVYSRAFAGGFLSEASSEGVVHDRLPAFWPPTLATWHPRSACAMKGYDRIPPASR